MIYLYHTPLSTIIDEPKARLLPAERQIIREHRHQILSAFAEAHGMPKPQYGRNQRGKPIATNSPLSFNHTHCQTHYALVYSPDVTDIGVDVESLDRKLNFDALARRYFHDDEYALWAAKFDTDVWFDIWTAKEATLKACGIGIYFTLKKVNTAYAKPDPAAPNTGIAHIAGVGQFYYQRFVADRHAICVALPIDASDRRIVLHPDSTHQSTYHPQSP